jgi:hypothetical protein
LLLNFIQIGKLKSCTNQLLFALKFHPNRNKGCVTHYDGLAIYIKKKYLKAKKEEEEL